MVRGTRDSPPTLRPAVLLQGLESWTGGSIREAHSPPWERFAGLPPRAWPPHFCSSACCVLLPTVLHRGVDVPPPMAAAAAAAMRGIGAASWRAAASAPLGSWPCAGVPPGRRAAGVAPQQRTAGGQRVAADEGLAGGSVARVVHGAATMILDGVHGSTSGKRPLFLARRQRIFARKTLAGSALCGAATD